MKRLWQNAKIMLNVNIMEAEDITAEDWRQLKDKWRKYLVGDESKDLDNEYVKKAINNIDSGCESAWNSMNKNKDAEVLFGNNPVTETTHMTSQFTIFYKMG